MSINQSLTRLCEHPSDCLRQSSVVYLWMSGGLAAGATVGEVAPAARLLLVLSAGVFCGIALGAQIVGTICMDPLWPEASRVDPSGKKSEGNRVSGRFSTEALLAIADIEQTHFANQPAGRGTTGIKSESTE